MIHFRSARGIALCSAPAKQEGLRDEWAQVTCPRCRKLGLELPR